MRRWALFSIMAVMAGSVFAQETANLKFEVASVKPNTSGSGATSIGGPNPNRFNAVNAPVRMLLRSAFRLQDFQIIGGPGWMSTDRFDIEARAEGLKPGDPCFGPDCPPGPLQIMLQNLLTDRFQLKTHRETREVSTYELTVVKSGFKLKEVPPPSPREPGATPPPPPPAPAGGLPAARPGSIMMGRGQLAAGAAPFANLVSVLSQVLGRPVVDKTGITGFYDFTLTWTPAPAEGGGPPSPLGPGVPGGAQPLPVDPAGPSIFTAIQEQWGLKLDSTKGPVDVLVVDSVSKPTEN
jgi:uncharacterized protein (TIGR03435 family)